MDKPALRTRLLAARQAMSASDRAAAAADLAGHLLGSPQLPIRPASIGSTATAGDPPDTRSTADAGGVLVAAYCSIGTEPSTDRLLAALGTRGLPVIVPLLLPDRRLDWARFDPAALRTGPHGLPTPTGPGLGVEAIGAASLVIVPALACSCAGVRLGRGGGSYDRALALLPAGVPVVALLYAGELLDQLPHEPHDRPVTAAALPAGLVWLG